MRGNGTEAVTLHEESLESKHKGIFSEEEPYAVDVSVVGVVPILFHRYDCEAVDQKSKAKKGSKEKKTDNVESYVYRDADGVICMPGINIKAGLCDAARRVQDPSSPRKSARDLFRAAIIVGPQLIQMRNHKGKPAKEWDALDVRPVVVQRNRITRQRPMLQSGWSMKFEIEVIDPEYISEELLHEVVLRMVKYVGLGDFRPDFGRCRVDAFKRVKLKS